jgi:hypothetical protein
MSRNDRAAPDAAQHPGALEAATSAGARVPSPAGLSHPRLTAAECELMAAWHIEFDGRVFCFAGYRYKRLADAVEDARRTSPQGPDSQVSLWDLD